jgi:chitodextrinase
MKNIAVLLSIVLIIVSCTPASPAPGATQSQPTANPAPHLSDSAAQSPTPEGIPNFDHIVLILLENGDYTEVMGKAQMPHLNALAQQYVLLSNYFAVRHPSLPNYIALMSGSTQEITKDCTDCFVDQPNLADRIEASGRTWKSYLESMPSPCFIGDADTYVQKHNPFLYFDSVRLNPDRCKQSIVPLTNLDTDLVTNRLPNFSFIVPNMCNSGYECEPQVADTWVYNMVTKLQASPAFGKNSLIIIAFDEANEHNTSSCCDLGAKTGGRVPAILISPLARRGFNDNTAYSHYSVLKLILSAWGLPDLGQSASAPQIRAPWEVQLGSQPTQATNQVDVTTSKPSVTTNCTTSSSGSKAYTITLCYSDIADGSPLTGDVPITAAISSTGTAPGVQRIVFYLDGSYLLTDYQSPYTFTLPTTKWADGSHVISVEALMRDNFTSQQSNLSVKFNNGIDSPPANTKQFQPTTGIPPVNGVPFIVVAGGDGAGGESNATSVSNLIASVNPNLFLYLGDVYEKGSPAEFYNWYGTGMNNFARFRSITNPTVGNHEYENGSALGYFDYWDNIPNYYSYNAGGWHFISLNSNSTAEPVDPRSAQYRWLQKDLATNTAACTIAYYHHPLYNIGNEGSAASMRDIWNLLAQYGVEIVLNGHDHTYQRWVPLDGKGQPASNGITEFVAGALGHGLQTFTSSDKRVAYSNDANPTVFGALILQLNQNGANFSYQNADGATLDSGVIPCAPSDPDTQAPTQPSGLSATATSAAKVELTWSASNDNTGVSGYTIYRNGTQVGTASAGGLTFSDTTATPDTNYTYSIDAFDPAGNHSAKSDGVSVMTHSMPSTLTFPVEADTYVSASSPQSNYGTATSWWLNQSPDMHAYLRFNVHGLGKTPITQARLLVYANNNSSLSISASPVADNNWDELNMDFTNAPALGTTLGTSGAFTNGSWVSLDVTSYVTGEGIYSFGLTSTSTTAISFRSRESGSNSALLLLDFSQPTTPAAPGSVITPGPENTPAPIPGAPGNQSVTFTPEADTYVSQESPNTNYGSATILRADASPDVHSYLRFKVEGLHGKSITKARLMLLANSSSPQGLTALTVADNNWGELTTNFSNAPSMGNKLTSSEVTVTGEWITLDVTPYITGEGTFSFGITTLNSTAISFASRESASANSPQLIIDLK